jgi:hypothetical protein
MVPCWSPAGIVSDFLFIYFSFVYFSYIPYIFGCDGGGNGVVRRVWKNGIGLDYRSTRTN